MNMKHWALFLLLLPFTVSADIGKFIWAPVTVDVAGAPTTVTGYILSCGSVSGTYTLIKPVAPVTELPINVMLTGDGVYHCVVQAENTAGKSDKSAELRFFLHAGTIRPLVPAAPVGFEVN